MPYLYQNSGSFTIAPVKARKVKADATPRAGVKFVPSDGTSWARHRVTDEQLATYLGESDTDKRAALVASWDEPVTGESAIHPAQDVYAGMLTFVRERAVSLSTLKNPVQPSAALLAMLSDGTLVLPSKARGRSANADAESAEARTARLAAEMFADADADTEPDTEPDTEGSADA